MSRKKTHSEFQKELALKSPNLTLCTLYKGLAYKVIVEDELGIKYSMRPYDACTNQRPNIITALDPTEAFIAQARLDHGDRYLYHKTEYVLSKKKVTITCKIHGDFVQTPHDHTGNKAQGCPECARMDRVQGWDNHPKYTHGYFYAIECFNENERFFKIGISYHKDLRNRYHDGSKITGDLPYNYRVVAQARGTLSNIAKRERVLKIKLKKQGLNYFPKRSFGGKFECFKAFTFCEFARKAS